MIHDFARIADRANQEGIVTYDPRTGTYPNDEPGASGYGLSIHPHLERRITGKPLTARHLRDYLELTGETLRQPGTSLGAWRDGDTWCLDVGTHVPTLAEALDLAKKHGQVAVWDVAGKRAIRLDEQKEEETP